MSRVRIGWVDDRRVIVSEDWGRSEDAVRIACSEIQWSDGSARWEVPNQDIEIAIHTWRLVINKHIGLCESDICIILYQWLLIIILYQWLLIIILYQWLLIIASFILVLSPWLPAEDSIVLHRSKRLQKHFPCLWFLEGHMVQYLSVLQYLSLLNINIGEY